MSAIAVVAGTRDAQFAEQVRAGLGAAGREATLHQQLPTDSSTTVVLIWSAALEAAHAIDAQALVGLWSEGRLTVARRDATPLPLGLRDLPSLGPETRAEAVCAAVLGAPRTTSAKPRSHALTGLAVLASVALVLGGSWYFVTAEQRARQSALTAALEQASKASEELKAAQAGQLDLLKKLESARAAELAARQAGDESKLREAQSEVKIAAADVAKQAALVKQREAAAADARRTAQDASQSAKTAAEAPKAAKMEVATAAPKAEAPKAEIPAATKSAPSDPSKMSRSQRERVDDERAAQKALANAGRAPVPATEQTPAAAAAPAPEAKSAGPGSEELYQQAIAMEIGGNTKDAIRLYRRAARAGSSNAAWRLGEIYDRGAPGVARDYAEALQWYETARQLGAPFGTGGGKEVAIPEPSPAKRAIAEAAQAAAKAPQPAKPAAPAAAPEPSPAPAAAAPEPAPEKRRASWRFAWIPVLVLAFILWRRVRKRRMRAEEAALPPKPSAAAAMPSVRAAQSPADGATLFVSYSHKDRTRVEPIVSVIEEMGRRVWMDRTDITGQAGWAGQIVRAIRECRAVVLMASPNSYSSDQVVRELYLAMNHKKAIVPIEIEPAEMPDELQYILAPFQHHRLSGGEARAVLGRALAAI